MKSTKQAIIIPPLSQKKNTKSGKRVQSADVKKKFSASGSQLANNNSYLSQTSKSSKDGRKDKLNTSLEEKKKRLQKLTQLLKGEKVNLKEEYGSEDEEEFEFLMKETALKEFQKQVDKQILVEDETQLQQDEFRNSTTIKKEQLPSYLNIENQNLQQTITKSNRGGIENQPPNEIDELQNGFVAKNPPPQRGAKAAMMNNFTEDAQPVEKKAAVPAQTKKDFQPKKIYTKQQKIFMCILIQSVVRMFIQRKKYLQERKRLELLLKEHQMEQRKKREEEEEEQLAIQQGKTPFSGRHTIHFTGIEKLLQNHQSQKPQINERASRKRTHSEGPFSLYQQMKENEEEGIIEENDEESRRYKLYTTKFNPLRKSRPPLPTKVPLNNNFFNDRGIIDCFVKKNRTNLPIQLKKSSSSGESYNLSTLPEYQELLKKSKQVIKQHPIQQKQQKQEEDSVIYSDTFEKESIEVSPNQKRFPFNKTTPQKRSSIHSISEDDYLKESFDMDTPKESIKESIRDSFSKESNRFQSSFSMSSKIKEDIPEESIIESLNESSIIDETEPKNRKKNASIQEEIQTSLEDEDYYNDKFESISEDLNNSEQKSMMKESITEDIAGMSFESRGKRGKKKSVTFSQERSAQIAKQLVVPQAQPASSTQGNQLNNNSGILRRSVESLSADQMVQISQKSKDSTQKYKESANQTTQQAMQAINEMYFGKEGLSDAWKKFENIRNQYDDEGHTKELSKEQFELGKLQKDIYQMLQNAKTLADKWQDERNSLLNSDKNASQKAEMVYQKFQSEFNRILQSAPMTNRFSLLKNYLEYRDRQMKNINLFNPPTKAPGIGEDTAAAIQKEVQSQVADMVQNLEQKQEIMYKVLVQVVENLQNIRQSNLEFDDMRRIKDLNNSKLDQLLANQEKMLKFQFEQEMVFREDQLKLLYSGKPITEEELNRIRIRQLLSQNRKEQIIPYLQLDRANIIPQILINPGQYETGQVVQVQEDKTRIKDVSLSSSIDMEAMQDSKISWQSGNDMWDNLNENDREQINNFNSEQIVNFLSEMLLQEIQDDLFPMRMTTSHLQPKKNDKLIQDKAMEKISPPKFHSQTNAEKKGGVQSSLQDSMSPTNRVNTSGRLKSDKTLTEESKYESDFEDSEDKFGQSLQSNRSNNKSYNFEENDTSGSKPKIQIKEDKYGQKKSDTLEEKAEEEEDEEELEYEQDFEESVEKQLTTQNTKLSTSNSISAKQDKKEKSKEEFDDPMGLNGKAFDRNSLLAEIEENDKVNPPSSLPKVSSISKNNSGKQKSADDEDYKGDNDFYKPQVENESGNIEKNPNKDLFKDQQYYDKTSRTLNHLNSILKKKKKLKIIKDVLETIAENTVKGKKVNQFIGNILKGDNMQVFENGDCKNNEEKVVAAAFQEHFYNNLIKNIQDLEQFHFSQAFNRKEIQAEIVLRWDHICDVAAQQTLQILEKVVPVDYYSDVKIDKSTPFKKVKRFCTINTVAKEDNELFELQNYELYKEQTLVQNELSDQVLQKIVNQLAKDLIAIQNKQSNKV